MALERAKILYDFDGDTDNGELIIKEGVVVTILNKDIGDGWWEGQLENGVTGLFPETYVEMMDEEDEEMMAETNMNGYEDPIHNGGGAIAMSEDQFEQESGLRHDSFAAPPRPADANKWDEEEDWEVQQREEEAQQDMGSSGGGGTTGSRSDMNSPSGKSQIARAGTVRKNINRFSSFVKTGSENYILGRFPAKIAIQPSSKSKIMAATGTNTSPMWEPNPEAYTIEVKDPEKKKKFKGIKSFLAYNIIPSSTGRAVSRRYKHYAWLHDRLEEKFSIHCVPPLPDKQYYGRYGEDFIEKRREKLQRWSNRIARHPILSRSDVFTHFIHCDGDGQWKTGKRRAEKDEVVGPVYLQTFYHPDVSMDISTAEATVERFGTFMHRFKLNLSRLRLKYIDHCQQMSGPFMAEFHKMSAAINGLATTFALEDQEYAHGLTSAIKFTSSAYQEIGAMHAEQPRNDMLPALDVMKEYLGLVFAFPDVVTIHRGAAAKVRECEKMKEEGRIDYTDATEITSRAESVSAVVLSEIYHFQHERVIDFREMMKQFLGEQISFYKEIVRKLEEAKSQYNDGTDL